MNADQGFTFTATGEGKGYDLVGDRCTIKIGGAQTGGAYMLIDDWVPPGVGTPPHSHRREDEAFYILEGEMTFGVDERTVTARPGALVHLPRGSLHWFRNDGGQPVRMLVFTFPSGFENFVAEVGIPVTNAAIPPAPPTEAHIGRVLALAAKYGIDIKLPA
jgi:quercetin dioxygenase-like cupin family protein